MAKRRRYCASERSTRGFTLRDIDLSIWPRIDEGGLVESRRELFLKRKKAVELYLSGKPEAAIRAETGYSRVHVYRLITERCLQTHEDGQLEGWRGLLPHKRLKPYIRTKPLSPDAWGKGMSGAMQLLLSTPKGSALDQRFQKMILQEGRKKRLEGQRIPKQDLIVWFLREVREIYRDNAASNWPFNVAKQGQTTISKYIDTVLKNNPGIATKILGGPEAQKKAKAGDGSNPPSLSLFRRVECDAHKLDIRCVVDVHSPAGGWEPILVHRIWVIVIIEVVSRCVLGYCMSVRREPSADDVLGAVRSALTKWRARELAFTKNGYAAGAGFPSHLGSDFVGVCWDEFSVDGALANICKRVAEKLTNVVNAKIIQPQDPNSYSSRRSLDDRPFIETFFRAFKEVHKLSPSTGSSPKDRKGREPEAEAVRSNFQLEYLEELLDVTIANYNATPHSSLGYRSPLKQMEFLRGRPGVFLRYADPGEVSRLLCPRKLCRVHATGRGKTGAYVIFSNARYSSAWLRTRMDLVGEDLWIYLEDNFDARYVSASTQTGIMLGTLRALPPWDATPHTLYMRSAIRSLDARKVIHLSNNVDPVEQLVDCAEQAPDRKLATHPAYLQARHVLQMHAERLTGQSVTTLAQGRPAAPSIARSAKTGETPTSGQPTVDAPPVRRKAINLGSER